jgi:hypothetical protein
MTSATPDAGLDLRRGDTARIELAVPAHLLVLLAHELAKHGWTLRADIERYLHNASVLPLSGLDELSVTRLARRVDDASRSLLRAHSPDEPRGALLAAAHFVLALVDEGLIDDPGNQAVLASLLLLDEARLEDDWRLAEAGARQAGLKLLARARLLGLYLPRKRSHYAAGER